MAPKNIAFKQQWQQEKEKQSEKSVHVEHHSQPTLTPDSIPLYTIQLIGAQRKELLEKYINKYELEDQTMLHETLLNEKKWYTVLYGQYNSFSSALSDIKNLCRKKWSFIQI